MMDAAKIRAQKTVRQGLAAALQVIAAEKNTRSKADTVKTKTETGTMVGMAEGEATIKAETAEAAVELMIKAAIMEAEVMVEVRRMDHHLHQNHPAVTMDEAVEAAVQHGLGRVVIILQPSLVMCMARHCRLTTQGIISTVIKSCCRITTDQSVLAQQFGLRRRRQDSQ